jgi:predicted Fe-S protein YdhL (DUF1289 family)
MKSPCVQVCQMDPRQSVCMGCRRTLDEIGRWAQMSDAERDRILNELSGRKDRHDDPR